MRPVPGGPGQAGVPGDQGRPGRLGHGHVDRVVGAQLVAQRKGPAEQRLLLPADETDGREPPDRAPGPQDVELTGEELAPERNGDLGVDQVRDVDVGVGSEAGPDGTGRGPRLDNELHDGRRVEHDHGS